MQHRSVRPSSSRAQQNNQTRFVSFFHFALPLLVHLISHTLLILFVCRTHYVRIRRRPRNQHFGCWHEAPGQRGGRRWKRKQCVADTRAAAFAVSLCAEWSAGSRVGRSTLQSIFSQRTPRSSLQYVLPFKTIFDDDYMAGKLEALVGTMKVSLLLLLRVSERRPLSKTKIIPSVLCFFSITPNTILLTNLCDFFTYTLQAGKRKNSRLCHFI